MPNIYTIGQGERTFGSSVEVAAGSSGAAMHGIHNTVTYPEIASETYHLPFRPHQIWYSSTTANLIQGACSVWRVAAVWCVGL